MKKWILRCLTAALALCLSVPACASGLSGVAREKARPAATEVPAAVAEPNAAAPSGTASGGQTSTAVDLSAMTDAELSALIDAARAELESRGGATLTVGALLYEDENLRIYMNGELELDEYDDLVLPIVLENLTERNLIVSLEHASCNGWELSAPTASVSAGLRAKDTFNFYDAALDAELSSAADVESIRGSIRYFDTDDFSFTIENSELVNWNF